MIESIVKKLFESRVDKLIEESDDLQWDKEWLETASTEDIRSELDNIKSKLDAAKSPAAVKKWEDLYDLYKAELKKRSGRNDESKMKEGVYSPYDHSDRDNSDYNKGLKDEEASHPYVGKKVRWSEDGRSYRVTGAYEDSRGITVRCGDITMKPDTYKFLKEATDSEYHTLAKSYKNKKVFQDMDKESGNIRDLIDDLDHRGVGYEIYQDKTDKGCTVFYN